MNMGLYIRHSAIDIGYISLKITTLIKYTNNIRETLIKGKFYFYTKKYTIVVKNKMC